ncbi:MAG: hypothetical protein NC908_00495 [Candidatus Omnitrophica bacterium]|nr:hypothetical protein [Candidatus Omnitrophota bacterium]
MLDKTKISIVVLVIIVVLSLSVAGTSLHQLQKKQIENLNLQSELANIKTRQKITEQKLEEYKQKTAELEIQLKTAQEEVARISNELHQEKDSKQQALSQIEKLVADLEQQKAMKLDLEKKLNQAHEDFKKAQAQLKELANKKTEIEEKLKELETKFHDVELGKIVVVPESDMPVESESQDYVASTPETRVSISGSKESGTASPKIGNVLVVNRDYSFIVISLGSKDGVSVGDIFSVYQNGKYLGDVKVEKVHDSMSAAGFLSIDIRNKVNEGDTVHFKTK